MGRESELSLNGSGCVPLVGSCGNVKRTFGSHKRRDISCYLRDC